MYFGGSNFEKVFHKGAISNMFFERVILKMYFLSFQRAILKMYFLKQMYFLREHFFKVFFYVFFEGLILKTYFLKSISRGSSFLNVFRKEFKKS